MGTSRRAVFGGEGQAARQQLVPIEPAEEQLAPMVDDRFLEQRKRPDDRQRELAGLRLGGVTVINQQRPVETGFNEPVGVNGSCVTS